ncbi:MAG: ABC transporter ATP-binding protein [Bacteroidota bacterium]
MSENRSTNIISLRDLAIGHVKNQPLLRDINLTVRTGEMVALIGRNGTGKSTLLKSMIGLLPLISGSCFLDGAGLETYDLRLRARKLSYVSSHFSHLPSISVREVVSLGRMPFTGFTGRLTGQDQIRIERALEEVRMSSFAERKLEHLSDGERQRSMIARALAQDTPLMVLDEPTAFLDIPNKYDLIQLLSGFRDQGKSIVYSTHDLDTAMHCADKIWVIYQDKILEGAPEDLGISGLFDVLFASEGVKYDQLSMRFRYAAASKGSVKLDGGEGKELLWTRSAIERLGFQLDDSGSIHIKVQETGPATSWVLKKEGQSHEFQNLYNLARFLNHID